MKNFYREHYPVLIMIALAALLLAILSTNYSQKTTFTEQDNKRITAINQGKIEPDLDDIKRYDLNGDGIINTRDVLQLRQILLGYVKAFNSVKNNPVLEEKETETHKIREVVDYTLYNSEYDLLYRCIEAKAGDQGLRGKQYVADVILNRVDSTEFPNTINEVINQKGQFAVVSCGMINTVDITEETIIAVNMELTERTNFDIIYFCTGNYFSWATPILQHGDHYFCAE